MAKDHGGIVTVTLTFRFRWWVKPLLCATAGFAWVMQPWLDDDDFDELTERVAGFVACHGAVLVSGRGAP